MRQVDVFCRQGSFEAEGLFRWNKGKLAWLLAHGLDGFSVEGESWTIQEPSHILPPQHSEYRFANCKGCHGEILFHGLQRLSASVRCEGADYELDMAGIGGVLRNKEQEEVLRIVPTWQDSATDAGISSRINYQEEASSLVLALAYGAYLLQSGHGSVIDALLLENRSRSGELAQDQEDL